MSRNANINSPTLLLLLHFFVAVASSAEGSGPFIQADVYNALYEANVQCDDNLDQSRSEFITDEFERNSGNRVSMELLTRLLAYNVQTAKQSITDKTQERELYISEERERLYVEVHECVLTALPKQTLSNTTEMTWNLLNRQALVAMRRSGFV